MKKSIYLLISLSFIIGVTIGSANTSIAQQTLIPSWIKNTALWWGQGQLSDSEFITAIQWLIDHGYLKTSPSVSSSTNSDKNNQTNPLLSLMPTNKDIGPLWSILEPTMSTRFHITITPPILSSNTIEQTFVKTYATPNTILQIDIANFQMNTGLSYQDHSNALNAYHLLNTDFTNKHPDYKKIQFIPSPAEPMATCVYYTKYTTESTEYDLICAKGVTLLVVDATGNDLSMSDDVNKMANILLKRIHGL